MAALNKKSVDDINVKGKRVLVRCDFNVPLQDGKITADMSKYQEFLANETRYSRLARAFPDRAEALFKKNQEAADARYEHLTKLVDLYK